MQRIFIFATLVAILAVVAFQLGFLDRPEFVEVDIPGFKVIVASSKSKDHGKDFHSLIPNLIQEVRMTILAVDGGKEAMAKAAEDYGAPKSSEGLPIALHFDDPARVKESRFAAGWVVATSDEASFQDIYHAASEASDPDAEIRAVHIVPGSALRGEIPWRSFVTPMVSPMVHWTAAYDAYEKGNYSSQSGRDGEEGSVALEVYLMGPDDSKVAIHYHVLMGDTSRIFDDMYPLEGTKSTNTDSEMLTEEEPEEEEPTKEEQVEAETDTEDEEEIDDSQEEEDEDEEEADDSAEDHTDEVSEDTAADDEEEKNAGEEIAPEDTPEEDASTEEKKPVLERKESINVAMADE